MKPRHWMMAFAAIVLTSGLVWSWRTFRDAGARKLYTAHCAACHGKQGEGIRKLIPPLAESDYLTSHWATMPCHIRHGIAGKITVNGIDYEGVMLPASKSLKPQEITTLLNYVGSNWGNTLPHLSFAQVDSALKTCP